MKVVNVRVSETENNRFKVIWHDSSAKFFPYNVNRRLIENKAREVREKLYQVVEEAREGINRVGESLRKLAHIGNDLYEALFLAKDLNLDEPEEVKKWLADLPKPLRIHIILESEVYIPWGLIYEGETIFTYGSQDDFNIEGYEDFWCLKYSVSSIYSRIRPTAHVSIPAEHIKILPLFYKEIYDDVVSTLDHSEKNAMKHIFSNFSTSEEPLFTSREFFTHLNKSAAQNTLIYICSHADGISIALNDADYITIDDLDLKLKGKKHDRKTAKFIFLNGCSTAVGQDGGGFLEATSNNSFYGFIGTEAKIPDVFAIRFGLDFMLSFLYSGKPVFEIMDNLRRRHWPLSLIYGVYCHPLLTISPSPEKGIQFNFEHKNFSLERLGSDDL
ncbi:MAG: hypothetical protein GY795_07475 [Desulfobacterales bacterium]|nr:hypothetical protein [Desulfobacterales bacterium]